MSFAKLFDFTSFHSGQALRQAHFVFAALSAGRMIHLPFGQRVDSAGLAVIFIID